MAIKNYTLNINDLQVDDLQDTDQEAVRECSPEQRREKRLVNQPDFDYTFNPEDLAKQILQRRSYIYSRTAYPVYEKYLGHLRAIAKIGDIPVSTVINNILALFFDEHGLLTTTNVSIKAVLNQDGHAATLKDYLGPVRPSSKKP